MSTSPEKLNITNLATAVEIRNTRAILEERGFRRYRLDGLGPMTVEVGTDDAGQRHFLEMKPWVMSLDEIDSSGIRGVIITNDHDDEPFGDWEIGKSWCTVLLDPATTDLDWWGQLCTEILLHLYVEKDFWGYVLIQCPKPAGWNAPDGWYFSALFMDEDGSTRWIWTLDRNECYPWRAHLGIVIIME